MKRPISILAVALSFLPSLVHAEFRALVVGVDSYSERNPEFGNLHGVKDAKKIEKLIKDYWPDAKIDPLNDKDATKEAIEDQFKNWLLKDAKPTDTLVFYFSGHGTTVPAPDLPSKIRSAIVPQNVRMNKNGPGIDPRSLITGAFFRDEMREMKNQMHLTNFTMIIDACQSGAISRGFGAVSKMIVNKAAPTGAPMKSGDGEQLFNADIDTDPFIIISAARADRAAWQTEEGGNLTVSFDMAIRKYCGQKADVETMSYSDLQDRILAEMANMDQNGQPQEPYVKGPLSRQLFGLDKFRNDPYYRVTIVKEDDGSKVHVAVGTFFGIDKNAILAIYGRNTRSFDTATPLARGKVVSAGNYDCTLELQNFRGDLAQLDAGRAIILSGVQDAFLNVDVSALKGNPAFEPVASGILSQKLMRSAGPNGHDAIVIPPGVTVRGFTQTPTDKWLIVNRTGNIKTVNPTADLKDLTGDINGQLRDLARSKAVIAMNAANPEYKLEIQAVRVETVGPEQNKVVTKVVGPLADPVVPDTQEFAFRVRAAGTDGKPLKSEKAGLFIAILDCTPDGNVSALFPDSGGSSQDTWLPADNQWRYVGVNLASFVDGKNPADLFAGHVGARDGIGQEVFKLMGTDEPVDYTPLLTTRRGGAKGMGSETELGQVLDAFLQGQPVKRLVKDHPPLSKFSIATTVLQLKASS